MPFHWKGIIDMKTGKNLDITTASGKGLITKTAVLQVLGTDAQIKGIVDVSTGDTLSVGVATRLVCPLLRQSFAGSSRPGV